VRTAPHIICCLLAVAALLCVQGSAVIYSRKVEYLYTLIYQALDMVHAQTKKHKVRRAPSEEGGVSVCA